jgi:lipopolysaccharide transport system ATP-binding protein
MTTAIKIENVSKLYRLGTVGTGTMAHDLNRWWHQIRGKEDPYTKVGQVNDRTQSLTKDQGQKTKDGAAPDYVWALRDINLEVQQGEILGIIGRNGAGKSTLLKLLSRVTAPTTGSIKTKGRIASLLEVGTGFHPELTGRENIYLNGAILGMKRHEITRRLNEIVEFSGCAKYVDTPVKRYSSGMMVRLGFAVAAHLDCEILIVDEVLAVGDMEFQNKCVGKLQDVSYNGRTILFVSHNMASITAMCARCVLLTSGQVSEDGTAEIVSEAYLQSSVLHSTSGVADLTKMPRHHGDQKVRFTQVELRNSENQIASVFRIGEPIHISIELESDITHELGEVGFSVSTFNEVVLFTSSTSDQSLWLNIDKGRLSLAVSISPNFLRPGNYFIQLGSTCGVLQDLIPKAIRFTIDDSRRYSGSPLPRLPGVLHFPFDWREGRVERPHEAFTTGIVQ